MTNKSIYSLSNLNQEYLQLVERSLEDFKDIKCFEAFIRECVRPMIPHRSFIAGLGRVTVDYLDVKAVIPVDCPDGMGEKVKLNTTMADRTVINEWLKLRKPLLIDIDLHGHMMSEFEKLEIKEFDLGRLGIHGQIDVSGRMASYFSFSHIPSLDTELAKLIEILSPHIHVAFMRTVQNVNNDEPAVNLSTKEMQVLKWIVLGRSNKEIALLLNKSERTVKNQVHAILNKIGAANRAEAINIADVLGLLSPAKKWAD